MQIHARFWVQKVAKQAVSQGAISRTVELAPVIRSAPLDDGKGNVDWAKYTPSGSIVLTVTADGAGEAFEAALGKDIEVTFTVVD